MSLAKYALIIPVYKNQDSISDLLRTMHSLSNELNQQLEVVFVVDGCPKNSFELLQQELQGAKFPFKLIRHSRNFGSFAAIRTGLGHTLAPYRAVMCADLQEPPQLMIDFFTELEKGSCDIVLGERISRQDPLSSKVFSFLFWEIYRKIVQPSVPRGGVDVFGCNQKVCKVILQFEESHSSLLGILFWVGFRRKNIAYHRLPRLKGTSSWSFSRKVTYLLDSCFSFTNLPIMMLMYLGLSGVVFSLLLSVVVLIAKLWGGITVPGYTATLLVILFFAGLNSFGLGLIGNYVWRAFENTKRRPLAIVDTLIEGKGKGSV